MFLLTTKHAIFVKAFCVIATIHVVRGKTCDTLDIRNNVANLNKLKNCTEIIGNLNIVLIEQTQSEADFQPYVFPELTRVTGYILFYKVKYLTSIGKLFPNLRLIRGIYLFVNYALVIHDMPHLKEVGLSNLLFIARGYVKISKSPHLCFGDTIDWTRIGKNTYLHFQKMTEDCPACPAKCNGHCWNSEKCQRFVDNCHEECLGCTRSNSNTDCIVCKNFDNNGTCISKCPHDKFVHRSAYKCLSEEECANYAKNNTWWVFKRECRSDCPPGYEIGYDGDKKKCNDCYNYCVKYCVASEIQNRNKLQDLEGCTHINSSLVITGLKSNDILRELQKNLGYVRYIRDYLMITRSDAIRDLGFLQNLTTINGGNLTSGKALVFYENPNLQKLWDFDDKNFTLTIKNGRIGFHDNEQLCLSEITKLAKLTGINYTPTDVSSYSNGALCRVPTGKELHVKIHQINATNVTLIWEKGDDIYYTVHYTEYIIGNDTNESQDVCSNNAWKSLSTTNNSIQLLDLKQFTTYYYYLRVYRASMKNEKTSISNFTTLAGDPDPPIDFKGIAVDHDRINLTWQGPRRTNGVLSNYFINVYFEPDRKNIAYERDYCLHPMSEKGAAMDKDIDFDSKSTSVINEPKERIYPACGPTNTEINIHLSENIWLYLCEPHSQSNYGFDSCKKYFYNTFNTTDIQIQKRSDEITSSKKKTSMNHTKGNFFQLTAFPNQTSIIVRPLKPFAMYVFYLRACNKKDGEAELCGPVVQTFVRTLRKPNSDDIPEGVKVSSTQSDVVVSWPQPKNPNAEIITYTLKYKKDLEHSQPTTVCIPQQKYLMEKRHVLKNMLPGNYYLMVQAVSLAGPGNFTKKQYFEVVTTSPTSNPFWAVFVVTFVLLVAVVVGLVYFRYKRKRRSDDVHLIASINPDYCGTIYIQDEWEIDRNNVQLLKEAGHGTFGVVYHGVIKSKKIPCAIKTVTESATIRERTEFLSEASVMKSFSKAHHVVKLLGVVSKGQPPLVIMELMERGDLKQYLRKMRDSSQNVTCNEIYRMAIEIADGMAYLIAKKFVHRDLAARNCMVGHDRTVKIGDFGMTRDIYETDYYRKGTRGLLPVRWMAPESLADGVFSSDSDVWSYGVVLWEIATLAEQPYQGLANEQVLQYIVSKGKMERPQECPDLLYEVMDACWHWRPNDRPTFIDIVEKLEDHVGQDFKLVSYYHSREGKELLITAGRERAYNPPALGMGAHEYDDDDQMSEEDGLELFGNHHHRPQFLPLSSQKNSRLSGEFH